MQTNGLLCDLRGLAVKIDKRIGMIDAGICSDDVHILIAGIPAAACANDRSMMISVNGRLTSILNQIKPAVCKEIWVCNFWGD